MTDVQVLARQLLDALGVPLPQCGSITVNVNEGEIQSVKTETQYRVKKAVERRPAQA